MQQIADFNLRSAYDDAVTTMRTTNRMRISKLIVGLMTDLNRLEIKAERLQTDLDKVRAQRDAVGHKLSKIQNSDWSAVPTPKEDKDVPDSERGR